MVRGATRGFLDAGGYVICGIDKDESNRVTYQRNNRNTTLAKDEPMFLAFDMFPSNSTDPGKFENLRLEARFQPVILSYQNEWLK